MGWGVWRGGGDPTVGARWSARQGRASRSRIFALLSLCYVGLIYATSGQLRLVQQVLATLAGPYWPLVPVVCCLLFVTALVWYLRRSDVGAAPGRGMLVYGLVAGYGVALVLLEIPAERIHLIQYGLLCLLCTEALSDRLSGWRLHLLVVAMVIAAGIGDELVQWVRPNRVGDLRDVAINGLAALLGQGMIAANQGKRSVPDTE
jgi:hypothetical protein